MTNEQRDTWVPVTGLGKRVLAGDFATFNDVLSSGYPIKEAGIVDAMLPDLVDEVISIDMTQRMTDSGRRIKFRAVVVVGNKDGYIGFGQGKDVQVGDAIKKAITNAKLNIVKIRRGCSSWECGCGQNHSVPMEISGKAGSVTVTLKPAPKGIGLVTGDVGKKVLSLAGIRDVWVDTSGKTRTTINFAKATYNALRKTNMIRVGGKK
ncbi:MAG TPA: 30S ribosomal protein S5 [Methanocorpusculum sp.]|nr:30S ribosomal protein S5 [Methanocorpusculum sp.]